MVHLFWQRLRTDVSVALQNGNVALLKALVSTCTEGGAYRWQYSATKGFPTGFWSLTSSELSCFGLWPRAFASTVSQRCNPLTAWRDTGMATSSCSRVLCGRVGFNAAASVEPDDDLLRQPGQAGGRRPTGGTTNRLFVQLKVRQASLER